MLNCIGMDLVNSVVLSRPVILVKIFVVATGYDGIIFYGST